MAELCRSDIVQVDLSHGLMRKHVGSILATGDKYGNRFGAEIFRDGVPIDIHGFAVTGYFLRPNKDAIFIVGSTAGNTAFVTLPQACYIDAGSFTLALKISSEDYTTTVRIVDGYILLTQTDDLVDPGEAVPTLDDIFAQIAAMEAATERAQAATADAIAAKDNANSAAVNAVNIATEKGDQAIQLAQEEADKQNVKIATLTEEIDEIATGHVNLLQRVERHDGYLYPFMGTTPEANEFCSCFERIRIYAGVTYYFKSIWRNFTSVYYDDGEFTQLPGEGTGIVYGEFVPTKDGYIYVTIESASTKYLFTTSKELNESGKNDTYYTPNKLRVKPVYHVEKDGSGDFTKLIDAVNEACKHMDATVYVGAGVWDIVEEYGDEFFAAAAGAGAPGSIYRGLYLKNRVHLIFSSKALVTCHYQGDNPVVNGWFAVFNAGKYGFTLENANIEASNIRYVIHDERDSDTERYVNRYINCRMTFDNSDNPRTEKVSTCIGGGLGCDGYIEIEGCVFNSIDRTAAAHITAVTYHNSASANAKSHISIRNCYLGVLNYFRINAYGASTDITQCEITGCSMGRAILVGHETGGTNMNVNVTEWNNTIR